MPAGASASSLLRQPGPKKVQTFRVDLKFKAKKLKFSHGLSRFRVDLKFKTKNFKVFPWAL